MSRSQESFFKKEVRNKKEKKRKEKAEKRQARRESEKKSSLDDMIAYVDAHGNITSTPPPEPTKEEEIKLEDIEVSVPKGSINSNEPSVQTGIITFYNESKGFGFIKNIETKQDVFFHVNNLADEVEVKEGNKVTFETEMGQRGPTAINVEIVK